MTEWAKRRPRVILAGLLAFCAAALVPWLAAPASREGTDTPACTGRSAIDLACQRRRHAAIVQRAGVDAAFAELKRGYQREGFLRAACHPITHEIGHAAVNRYGKLADAYARGDPFCSAGYFHGVTARIIEKIGPGELIDEANRLCGDLGGHRRHSIYHRNCAHGLGHGFMLVRHYDLRDSLATCDELSDDWERRSCYGGVFMENVMTLGTTRKPTKSLRPDDPLYPCHALDRRYRNMCYQKQTGYALYIRDDDFAAVFKLCGRVERAFRPACHQGLGTNVAVQNLKRVFQERQRTGLTAGTCMSGRDRDARANCLKGAVRALI
ncbi:MAG: hypothetical protein LC808_08530, partial [Actinobacteria bacterium]|nr:hypothetical protein [Actinomycetota bacterium]